MISVKQLYKDIGSFCRLLDEHQLKRSAVCLVKIFTSCLSQDNAVSVAKAIRDILPNAYIVGSTAAGIIFEGRQYEDETMVLVEKYEHLNIRVRQFSWKEKSARSLAEEVHRSFRNANNETVHILFSDRYYDVNNFVNEISALSPKIRLAGGIAGDLLASDTPGFVFTDEGVPSCTALAFSVTGEEAVCFIDVNTAQEPISPIFTVTGTDGCLIKTIEGEPADQWMYRYLALEDMRSFGDWKSIADNDHLIRFQMILEGHGTAGRFTRYDEQAKSLALYFSQIEPGTKFRIGYTNPSKCVRDCYALCQNIMEQPVECVFVYTCLFRKLYMSNSSKWELLPFLEYIVCGIFMMWEIGFIDGRNEFFNGSCLVTGIAESKRYLMPDISVLDEFTQIEDDMATMEFAMVRQKEAMSDESRNLITELKNQRLKTERHMYVDARLGLSNVLKYKEDRKRQKFNKLCMMQMENDDMLISFAGLDAYLDNTLEILEKIQAFLVQEHYDRHISFYCVTQSIFFLTGTEALSKTHFEQIMREIYEDFHFYKSSTLGLSQMARFVVVMQQKDMLQGGLNALQATKDIQSRFVVCDEKSSLTLTYAEELRVIELLNYAIYNDGVVPYYQGIRDNHSGQIHYYEALMRLIGADGEVNCPMVFLAIAQKYRLYSTLSHMMIERVLRDFANRQESVSINISAYDVNSKDFVNWFFRRLGEFPNPDRITVEFVESEDFRESEEFMVFVKRLRQAGCRISVDDFGTGYSSLEEVIRLEPDYIKVDGSIICGLKDKPKNMILLKTIIFLARQLGLNTIAEFVENEETQALLEQNGLDYSQGYLFSEPNPLGALPDFSRVYELRSRI